MGRLLLTAVTGLLMIGAVVRVGGTLHLWAVPDSSRASKANPQSMSECLAESESTFRSMMSQDGVAAASAPSLGPAKLASAMRLFCKAWLGHPETASLTQETGPRFASQLFRDNPSVYKSMCQAGIDADMSAHATMFQFLSKQERTRLRRTTCPLQLRYMKPDAPSIDFTALIAAHPDLYVLGCGAALQLQLSQTNVARTRFTRAERRRIAQRSCREALRTGLVNASNARGLFAASVDEQSLDALVLRYARQEAR